jgi:sarcosine oxidase subunit beta
MRYSEEWYANINDHLHTPTDSRERVIVPNGYLWLYEDAAYVPTWDIRLVESRKREWEHAQQRARMQQEIGLPVEILSSDEVLARWPHLNGDAAMGLVGGTWCPTDGFLRHDLVYTLAIRRAIELGAIVLQDTEVVGGQMSHGRLVGLIVNHGGTARVIDCDAVINCTNAWANRVSSAIGGMDLPVSPLKRYLGFVQRNGVDPTVWSNLPFTIYGDGYTYSRPDGDQLMIGRAHYTHPEHEFTDADQDRIETGFGHDFRGHEPYVEDLRKRVGAFAPDLVTNPVTATTAGYYGTTPDANPLIGWDTQIPGLMHAAGFSGHGLMHAPITALLVRGIATNDTVLVDGRRAVRIPGSEQVLFLDRFDPGRDFSAAGEHAVL